MPRNDGTGPMGHGAMSGKGFGACNGSNSHTYGHCRALGFGKGNNCRRNTMPTNNSKAFLAEQKTMLEARLEAINKQLNE